MNHRKTDVMKLQDLDIIITAPPAPGWGGRYWILVKLTTACGITGWGECYAASVGPEAMRAVITDVFQRHMEGENPENIELMFRRAYSFNQPLGDWRPRAGCDTARMLKYTKLQYSRNSHPVGVSSGCAVS